MAPLNAAPALQHTTPSGPTFLKANHQHWQEPLPWSDSGHNHATTYQTRIKSSPQVAQQTWLHLWWQDTMRTTTTWHTHALLLQCPPPTTSPEAQRSSPQQTMVLQRAGTTPAGHIYSALTVCVLKRVQTQ